MHSVKNRVVALSTVTAGMGLMTMQAQAALPTAVGDAFTLLETDAESLINLAWPVIAAVVVAFILVKLFKRGASKV